MSYAFNAIPIEHLFWLQFVILLRALQGIVFSLSVFGVMCLLSCGCLPAEVFCFWFCLCFCCIWPHIFLSLSLSLVLSLFSFLLYFALFFFPASSSQRHSFCVLEVSLFFTLRSIIHLEIMPISYCLNVKSLPISFFFKSVLAISGLFLFHISLESAF